MSVEVVEPSCCPLCGGGNSCASVAGADNCWCLVVRFPQELLDKVPKERQNKACICKRCVDEFNESQRGSSSHSE